MHGRGRDRGMRIDMSRGEASVLVNEVWLWVRVLEHGSGVHTENTGERILDWCLWG